MSYLSNSKSNSRPLTPIHSRPPSRLPQKLSVQRDSRDHPPFGTRCLIDMKAPLCSRLRLDFMQGYLVKYTTVQGLLRSFDSIPTSIGHSGPSTSFAYIPDWNTTQVLDPWTSMLALLDLPLRHDLTSRAREWGHYQAL